MADASRLLPVLAEALLNAPRRPLETRGRWAADVPREAGVYAIWDRRSRALVYVGETSGLRDRFGDLSRLPNHTFRRYAARLLKVTRARGEAALSTAMAARFEIGYLVVNFGRAELEEFLVLRFRNSLVNKPAKRLLRSPQYEWVAPV